MTTEKTILDACCGNKMFWLDKDNPHVLFCDNRELSVKLCDGRIFEVKPDMICDFTALPFPDESFWHVVFDPPHIIHGGDKSWVIQKYGKLPKNWQQLIRSGFFECWRVLKTNGTLVFKWAETNITLGEIIKTVGREPLYGQRERKTGRTHWMCFVKFATKKGLEVAE